MAQKTIEKSLEESCSLSLSLARLVNSDEKSAVLSREDPLLCSFLFKTPRHILVRCSSGSGTRDQLLNKCVSINTISAFVIRRSTLWRISFEKFCDFN
ncbi:hypothetical protein CEXT_659961 [Caerostris extrusa]|uniref:Uncharacterized protein n=1 Tax=Caerostris extrusa TaxID=172846 RepID=A0AAV4MII4_CAEEX|nr:hypothetical protein CEXT_659961 [Caerostris extrusa]